MRVSRNADEALRRGAGGGGGALGYVLLGGGRALATPLLDVDPERGRILETTVRSAVPTCGIVAAPRSVGGDFGFEWGS